jgi:hypothetical protein
MTLRGAKSGDGLLAQVASELSPGMMASRLALLLSNTFVHYEPYRAAIAKTATFVTGAGLALGALGARGSALGDRRPAVLLWVALLLTLLPTLLLPHRVSDLAYTGSRFALPALLLLVAFCSSRPRAEGARARWAARALAFAGSAALSLVVAETVLSVSRELAPATVLARRLAGVRPAPRILPLFVDPRTRVVTRGFDLAVHSHDAINLVTGGSDPYLFDNPFLPVRLKANRVVGPGLLSPLDFDSKKHGRDATHVLVRLGVRDPESGRGLVERLFLTHDLEMREGDWLLFRRR